LTGTAAHVQGVGSIDNHHIGDGQMGPLTREIQSLYFDIVTGRNIKYSHWCTKA
jgi:Branched-chain amino acid aminotransferase/4-amino-4-deoxychorismate lyase